MAANREISVSELIEATPFGQPVQLPHGKLYPLTEGSTEGVWTTSSGRIILTEHLFKTMNDQGHIVASECFTFGPDGNPYLYCRELEE
ncbi:hypothetical protein BST81_13805 [Leptolyngbya sp. 'hensonii']|uniref:hypothetical protein n=1 Tax=Leptolyngbya sp. 'hensonii' TaxID=1922337 RepID=UPI00094FD1AC|nr:hypothetical protein [Leptolyngbya sp. 'hensonii']OLP18095.1 hypothetical protein BST81_13805 [Leptolyngbya sp. 'hensonii']